MILVKIIAFVIGLTASPQILLTLLWLLSGMSWDIMWVMSGPTIMAVSTAMFMFSLVSLKVVFE